MSTYTERQYSQNLRILDQISSKIVPREFMGHRKTISQPDIAIKQPDRMDLQLNQHLILLLSPGMFKYLRIKCKDQPKPMHFQYDSSNIQASIKFFLSSTTDSPNILNHHQQVQNKSRFLFNELPTHNTKFTAEYVYVSVYSDKYTELKIRAQVGLKMMAVKYKISSPSTANLLKEPGSYSRRKLQSDHRNRSNNSFIKSNKESQVRFKTILEEKNMTMKLSHIKQDQILERKRSIVRIKQMNLIENGFFNEVHRLEKRVDRLKFELTEHIMSVDIQWFNALYIALLARAIQKSYYARVRRIVVTNKVQVCCRKFMRIMKSKVSRNYKKHLHMDCVLLFSVVASGIKKQQKRRSYRIVNDFINVFSYQSDGIKKILQFWKKIHVIQVKWRSFKKLERQYYQKCVFNIQQKWYQVYKQLQIDGQVAHKQAPPQDRNCILIAIQEHLELYKKQFNQAAKLVQSLKMAKLSIFRPLTITLMKEVMLLYLQQKAVQKQL